METGHNKNMENALADLGQRLEICADKLGSKKALGDAAGISQAQLFRYIRGESEIPAAKALNVARVAKVDPTWLLSGDGKPEGIVIPRRPEFKPELLQQVSQLLDETLLDYTGRMTPKQKARALPLLYEGFRAEEQAGMLVLDKSLMLDALEFMTPLKQTDDITTYHKMLTAHFIEGEPLSYPQALILDRLVGLGTLATYEGVCGQMYYDRMGMQLSADGIRRLLETVSEAQQITGKKTLDWLDLGCGNGRHLAFLASHSPHIKVWGVDPSALALRFANNLVRTGKVAAEQIQQADARQLPFANDSMDAVYWRMGLHHMPSIPGVEVGAALAFKEIARVLRPGGTAFITAYCGNEIFWAPFHQQHTEESLAIAAKPYGLKLVKRTSGSSHSDNSGVAGRDFVGRYEQPIFSATLVKA